MCSGDGGDRHVRTGKVGTSSTKMVTLTLSLEAKSAFFRPTAQTSFLHARGTSPKQERRDRCSRAIDSEQHLTSQCSNGATFPRREF